MSRAFLAEGHSVGAVTCFPNHPTGTLRPEDRGRWRRTEELDGIDVERCWSLVTPNQGFFRKTLGHLSFMATGWRGLSRAARRGRPDVVVVSSPTFFSVFTAWGWCAARGIPWVFEVLDLLAVPLRDRSRSDSTCACKGAAGIECWTCAVSFVEDDESIDAGAEGTCHSTA